MTLLVNSAEGGTNGVDVSNANSGGASGTAFTGVSNVSTATEKYSNTQSAHGSTSVFFNGAPGGCEVYWSIPAATSIACRVYVRFNTLPGNCWLLNVGFSGLGTSCFIAVNSAHQVYIADLNGTIKTFTNVLTTGVWYRLELEVQIGTTSSNGYIAGRYFLGDATTPAETEFSSSTANTSVATAKISQVDIGLILGGGSAWMDDFAASDGTTTPLGPAIPSAAPFAGWGIPMGTAPVAATATASMTLAATAAAAVTPVAATATASMSLAASAAAAAVITPATVVAPVRRGKPVSTLVSPGSTTVTATLPQTPTAGNLLIALAQFNGSSTTPSCSTPTGWTAGPFQRATSGTNRFGLFLFWKLATGSEPNPVFTVVSGEQGGIILQEWAGLDATTPHLADSVGAQVAGSGTVTLTDAITTTTANEWVFTGIASVAQANVMSPLTWTLPQLSFDAPTNTLTQVKTNAGTAAWAAGCYSTSGAKAPQAVTNVGASAVANGIVSMSFKLAAGSRAQVLESVYTDYSTATATWTATLATTPDPADVLICAIPHLDTLGAVSISGCGATWTLQEIHDTAAGYDMHVWTGINPTGAGAVTVTSANTRQGKIRVLRVSGVGQSVSTTYSRTTGLSVTGPSVTAGPGQLVVALQATNGISTSDFPVTSANPALGNWATDALLMASVGSGAMQDAWSAPSAPGTSHTVTGTTATSSRTWTTAMVVVG